MMFAINHDGWFARYKNKYRGIKGTENDRRKREAEGSGNNSITKVQPTNEDPILCNYSYFLKVSKVA